MLGRFVCCISVAFLPLVIFANDEVEVPLFNADEQVVFLGDSITHQGHYLRFVSDYYLTRWPTRTFTFLSAGVSGDTTDRCLPRLEEDVYAHHPDVIPLMFGMNDVRYWLYASEKDQAGRDAALSDFATNLCRLVSVLRKNCPDARLVLMTPSPYDETSTGDEPPLVGVNAKGLTAIAKTIREMGKGLGIGVVDLHAPMTAYATERQQTMPGFSLCQTDRIHPDLAGAFVLAKTFLAAQAVPSIVSDIRVDAKNFADAGSINAEMIEVRGEANGVSFTAKELALPFIVPEEVARSTGGKGRDPVNCERLTVSGLAAGCYDVVCDGISLGRFSDEELDHGINLAMLTNAPGFRQARQVDTLNEKRYAFESDRLRAMACVRWYLRRQGVNVDDFESVRRYIEQKVLTKPRRNYYEGLMSAYLSDWPRRSELKKELAAMSREIDRVRQPAPHVWRIVSMGGVERPSGLSDHNPKRVVELVDFADNPGVVHCHGMAKAERSLETEGARDFIRFALTSALRGWAGLRFDTAIPSGTTALEFIVRTPDSKSVNTTVTLSDSSGQHYQYALDFGGAENWKSLRLELSSRPFNQWKDGGEKPDGAIHFPILNVSIDSSGGKGYDLLGCRAITSAGPEVLPDFELKARPTKEHGLWYPNDSPRYTIEVVPRAAGTEIPDDIMWALLDFWGDKVIASGELKRTNGALTLDRSLFGGRFGSFKLTLTAGDGVRRVTRDFWFARLTGDDPGPCSWIGTIGGGCSWDLFRAMGVGRMNCSLGWNQCEPKKGVYEFPQWFDTYVTNMLAHGIKPHLMAHKPNPIYENPLDPVAFSRYVAAYARHFAALGVDGVEIWNEPRGVFRKQYGDTNRIVKFVEFSRMARDAIKAAVPDMTVSVCAEDMGFDLLPMIGMNIARPGDAISFHPYCHTQPRPERSYFFSDNGRAIRNLAKSCGGATNFRISELGWTTFSGEGEYLEIAGFYPRASLEHQAQYIVRSFIMARQSGVDYLCQYRFEDMSRRNYTEHNFGFVFEDYTPKPSFCAMAFMARILGKAEPSGALSEDLDRYRISSFVRGGRRIFVCWAVEKPVEWALPANFDRIVKCFDLMGNEIKPPFVKDRTLRLTERPFYIIGEK